MRWLAGEEFAVAELADEFAVVGLDAAADGDDTGRGRLSPGDILTFVERMSPAEAGETGVVAIGCDPLTAGFNGQGGEIGIGD
jgi:hypothetical protein